MLITTIPLDTNAQDIWISMTPTQNLGIGGTSNITGQQKGGVSISWNAQDRTNWFFTLFRNGSIINNNIDRNNLTIYDSAANDMASPNKPTISGSPTYKRDGNTFSAKIGFNQGRDNGTTYSYEIKGTPRQNQTFQFTGYTQSFTAVCSGTYRMEIYGGGTDSRSGGRTTANIYLTKGQTIYVNVGGYKNTYNGGASGGVSSYGAGGATSIQTTNRGQLSAYKNVQGEVLIVAGGAGADGEESLGGNGGGGNQNGQNAGNPSGNFTADQYSRAFSGGNTHYWNVKYGTGGTQSKGGSPTGWYSFDRTNYKTGERVSDWTVENTGGTGDFGQGGTGVRYKPKYWYKWNSTGNAGYYRDYYSAGGGGGWYGGGGGGAKFIAGVGSGGPTKKTCWSVNGGGGGGSGHIRSDLVPSANSWEQQTGVTHSCKTNVKNGCAHISLLSADGGNYAATSGSKSVTVTTGVYSTYYRIDQNASTTLNSGNVGSFKKGFSGSTYYNIQQHETYLHIANIDNAGNISGTTHYQFGDVYKIDYDLNGGREVTPNKTFFTNTDNDFKLNEPVKDGYIFIGWTGSNGDTPQKDITIHPKTTKKDLKYKANWTRVVTTKETIQGDNLYTKSTGVYYIKQGNNYILSATGYSLDDNGKDYTANVNVTVNVNRLRIKRLTNEIIRYANKMDYGKKEDTSGIYEFNNLSSVKLTNLTNTRNETLRMTSQVNLRIDDDNIALAIYPQAFIENSIIQAASPDFEEAKKITVTSDGKEPIITTNTDKVSYEKIKITDKQAEGNNGSGINLYKTKIYLVSRNYVYNADTITTEGYDILGNDSAFTQNKLISRSDSGTETNYTISYDFSLKEIRDIIQKQKMDYIVITEDNVGNKNMYREHVDLDVGVDGKIANVRNNNAPVKSEVFKSGETGYVLINFTGTPDSVIVEFPECITNYRPDLAHMEIPIVDPTQPVKITFTVNKNASETDDYQNINITAKDSIDGKEAHDTVSLKIENKVKDEISTRIRQNE